MNQAHGLTVAGRYENIQQVCQFMTAGAQQAGLDETAVFHVELACDEACTNIIEHAYGGEDVGDIRVTWQVTAVGFVMKLQDNGRSFKPNNIAKPNLPPTNPDDKQTLDPDEIIANLKVGGLGIHFMRKLMDEVRYDFDEATGNTLVMVKHFTSETS